MTTLKDRVEEFLKGLGQTADEVAETLRRLGVRGVRESGDSCPIANAIRHEFPEAREENGAVWEDDVIGNAGKWFVDLAFATTPEGRVYTPRGPSFFIEEFDNDREFPYRDLEVDE